MTEVTLKDSTGILSVLGNIFAPMTSEIARHKKEIYEIQGVTDREKEEQTMIMTLTVMARWFESMEPIMKELKKKSLRKEKAS
jgi:K+/H+ antiporter YhaU regulatory subunit KhtT